MTTTLLRADLIGSNACSALGITAHGPTPVLALCRRLIEAGHGPKTPMEVYRGRTLCLRVRSIGEAAALSVSEATQDGKPRFVRFRPGPDMPQSVGGRSPIAQTEFAGAP